MKFIIVMMLMILSMSAVFAGSSLTVGVVNPTGTNITSIEYTVTQPGVGAVGTELALSYAGSFQSLKQSETNKRYGLGLGLYATKGIFTVDGGYGIYGQTATGNINPGLYSGVKVNIVKNLYVEGKYTYVFNDKDTNGWQFGVGLKF